MASEQFEPPCREGEAPEDRDWRIARETYEAGGSYRACEQAIDGRISYQRIRRRAKDQDWVQGEVTANATPEQRAAQTAAATQRAKETYQQRKARLVDSLLDTVERLQEQVFSPHELVDVKVVPVGGGSSEVEVVRTTLNEPTPADKKALATSMAILIDKTQLLAGEATSRTETGPLPDREAVEARLRQVRDELAEKRAAAAEAETQAS